MKKTQIAAFGGGVLASLGLLGAMETTAAAADPLDSLHLCTLGKVLLGSGVYPVAFANGAFYTMGLVAGPGGTLSTSTDGGNTWSNGGAIDVGRAMTSIAFANNTFVVGTWNGIIDVSQDGRSWTTASAPQSVTPLTAVAYGSGTWVFKTTGATLRSSDLQTWTRAPSQVSATGNMGGIAFGNRVFAAASTGGIETSPDAVTWTSRLTNASLNAVAYGAGGFVAVGNAGAVETSLDGVTWTKRSLPTLAYVPDLHGIAYGKGGWVAVGGASGPGGFGMIPDLFSSPDGVTWTQHVIASSLNTTLYSVAFGTSTYVVTGTNASGQLLAFATPAYPIFPGGVAPPTLSNPTPVSIPTAPATMVHKP